MSTRKPRSVQFSPSWPSYKSPTGKISFRRLERSAGARTAEILVGGLIVAICTVGLTWTLFIVAQMVR